MPLSFLILRTVPSWKIMSPVAVPLPGATAAATGIFHSTAAAATISGTGRITKPLLLVSDLDDTLIGSSPESDASTAAFKDVWTRSKALGINCMLAINTGRTLPLFEAAWETKRGVLPPPDILIAGVGTRCYFRDASAGGWTEETDWTALMYEGWDAQQARRVMDDLVNTFGPHNVVYREPVEMHDHKLTVLYRTNLREKLMLRLRSALQQAHILATIIEGRSGQDPDWCFIDLLPQHAGKGHAMQFIQRHFGFDDSSTVAAGDSINDLLMLQQARLAVVVGNAAPEVMEWAQGVQQHQQQKPSDCQDPQGKFSPNPLQRVYVAKQPVAAGVLEGLKVLGMLHADEDEPAMDESPYCDIN